MNENGFKKRIRVIIIVMGLCLSVLLGRLFLLQILRGDKYTRIASVNIIRTTVIPPPRGDILDRHGKLLAHDLPRLNICAVRSEIGDIGTFSKTLAPLIAMKPEDIEKEIEKYKDNPYQKFVIKPKVDTPTMMRVVEVQPDLPGLHLEVQPVREYPNGSAACHIIGYVGEITEEEIELNKSHSYQPGDSIGKDGIEKKYDQDLRGVHGERNVLVDATGRTIRLLSETKPIPGKNVYLSLDLELQKEMEEILSWHVKSLSHVCREPLAAAAIIMDARTGEILAMSSVPGFDPNQFSMGISTKDYNALISRKDYPLLNRTIAGAYPPASTFKMITGTAALQEGTCTRYSPFFCPGFYEVGNQHINCFVKTGHGRIDFNNAIAQSCDVTFYFLGEKLGHEKLIDYCEKYGLGHLTGIDLPGEIEGILPTSDWKMWTLKEPWYTGDTINLSIGQGYLNTTPLQMAVVTAAVANKGAIVKPHLLEKITSGDGKSTIFTYTPKPKATLAINRDHFDAIQEGMRSAVNLGTAKSLSKCRMSVGGKTGTAENFPSPENPNGRNHTWFAGFTPAHDPDVVIIVFFEKSGNLAGRTAVPIAAEILDVYCRREEKIR